MRASRWIWLGPAAFAVHDAEEILLFQPWFTHHEHEIPEIARSLFGGIHTRQFASAVVVLFVGYLIVAALGARAAARGRLPWPYVVVTGAFVGNGITHVLQAAAFRGYTPGVVTAVLISLPYGWLAARALVREGLATRQSLLVALAVGIAAQVPLALLALAVGRQIGT